MDVYIFCYSNNNVYFFFISLIDIKPKMGQINIRKNDFFEKYRWFFKKFRLNSKEI